NVVAVLRGVTDAPALLRDAALPHEVDDELQLVQHLKVRDLGLVAGLGEGLKAVLYELRYSATEHGLLTEQVGLGLFGESGLDATRTKTTDGLAVAEHERP